MKRLLILLIGLLMTQMTFSKVLVDDLYYNLDDSNRTAEVTYLNNGSSNRNYVSGNVTIPDYIYYGGKIYDVVSIGNLAFVECRNLTDISIPSSITTIGNRAFYNCSQLTSVTIPVSVVTINYYAFINCTNLKEVFFNAENCETCGSKDDPVFPSNLTSLIIGNNVKKIPERAFIGCNKLTDINIPNSVNFIGDSAFRSCSGLSNLKMGDAVTFIGNEAFAYCSNLTSFNIPASVTNIGYSILNNCNKLEELIIQTSNQQLPLYNSSSSYKTFSGCNPKKLFLGRDLNMAMEITSFEEVELSSAVTTLPDNAFLNCSSLKTISLPESVSSIGIASFKGCSSLKSIKLSSKLTAIPNDAFSGCTVLAEINLHSGIKSIGSNSFYNCQGLESLYIQASENILNIESSSFTNATPKKLFLGRDTNRALGITSLTEIEVGYDVTTLPNDAFRGCTKLTNVIMPVQGWGLIQLDNIGNYAFYNCTSLPSISLPSSVSSIGSSSFEGCSSLQSIELSPKMTTIPYSAFNGCTVLSDINLPSGITSIGSYAFRNCTSLPTINFPSGLSGINSYAFQNCTILDNLTLPNNLNSIGTYAFDGCSSLSSLMLPGNTVSIGSNSFSNCTSLTMANLNSKISTVSSYAFQNCTSLNAIVFPDQLKSIESNAFQGCTALPAVILSETLTSVGNYAFSECTALSEVKTSPVLQTVGESAFYNCNFSEILLPATTSNIGANAFNGNENLMTIYSYNPTAPLCANSNSFSVATKNNAKLYIPATGLSNYRGAVSWSEFPMANYMQLVELDNIIIEAPSNRLRINKQMNLEAILSPENTTFTDVVWGSTNPKVASISETGEVTALSTGFTVITAKSKGINALEGLFELEVIDFLLGDSNDSDFVTITDAVNIASYVMDEEPEVFNFEASDVNEDGTITLADASGVISIILNDVTIESGRGLQKRGINVDTSDFLVAEDFELHNDFAAVPVALRAENNYIALQADIKTLGGLTLDEIVAGESLSSSHLIMTKRIDDSTMRVVVYSPALNIIDSDTDCLFEIMVSGMPSEGAALSISNILATTNNLEEHELGFSGGALMNGTTGISSMDKTNVNVEAGQGVIRVLNAIDEKVGVYTLDGRLAAGVASASDLEIFSINSGMYVVKAGNKSYKVVVK